MFMYKYVFFVIFFSAEIPKFSNSISSGFDGEARKWNNLDVGITDIQVGGFVAFRALDALRVWASNESTETPLANLGGPKILDPYVTSHVTLSVHDLSEEVEWAGRNQQQKPEA